MVEGIEGGRIETFSWAMFRDKNRWSDNYKKVEMIRGCTESIEEIISLFKIKDKYGWRLEFL